MRGKPRHGAGAFVRVLCNTPGVGSATVSTGYTAVAAPGDGSRGSGRAALADGKRGDMTVLAAPEDSRRGDTAAAAARADDSRGGRVTAPADGTRDDDTAAPLPSV